MNDKKIYQRIEQFDEYPERYQPQICTQQKLIQDAVNSLNSKVWVSKNNQFRFAIAVFSIAMVTVIVYFSMHHTPKEIQMPDQLTSIKSESLTSHQFPNQMNKSVRTYTHRSISKLVEANTVKKDSAINIGNPISQTSIQADTIVALKNITFHEPPKLFAKKTAVQTI